MNNGQQLFPILGQSSIEKNWKHIDLQRPGLKREQKESTVDFLYRILEDAGAYKNDVVLYGGYLEKRIYYSQSSHFKNQIEDRNIHIGLDIWAKEGTSLYAPVDLTIHSKRFNDNYLDYGGAIITKVNNNGPYLLFGHVSVNSLDKVIVNQQINRGQIIAELGDESENGGWPPHLHFQIILDIENYKGDYPGVVNENRLSFYTKNCPNPSSFVREIQ